MSAVAVAVEDREATVIAREDTVVVTPARARKAVRPASLLLHSVADLVVDAVLLLLRHRWLHVAKCSELACRTFLHTALYHAVSR